MLNRQRSLNKLLAVQDLYIIKSLELKKKQYHIGPDTLIKRGQFGVAPLEVIENEEEFYKSVLR